MDTKMPPAAEVVQRILTVFHARFLHSPPPRRIAYFLNWHLPCATWLVVAFLESCNPTV